jgi:uncharacterized protein YkwD
MFHVKPSLLFLLLLPLAAASQHFSTSTIEVKPLPVFPEKNAAIVDYIRSFPETKSLTADEFDWFYWTNYSRTQPRNFYDSVVAPVLKTFPNLQSSYSSSLRRDLYQAEPLEMIRPNRQLAKVAQGHANNLRESRSGPSHSSPSGETFQARMTAANVKNCAGENISFGPSNTVLALVFLYIDEGLPEVGHRKSLLNPSYKQMGIGISTYPNNNYMVVQDFSCDQ